MTEKEVFKEDMLQLVRDVVKRNAEKVYDEIVDAQEGLGHDVEDADPYDIVMDVLQGLYELVDARQPNEEV